ncbi:hypothetical protein BHE74_00016095 [Ensete ventricosum]|nr:hypothetical protein BHE74_00016095 [Ensete ventricosum]
MPSHAIPCDVQCDVDVRDPVQPDSVSFHVILGSSYCAALPHVVLGSILGADMACLRAPEVRSLEGGDARPKKRPKLGVQKVSKSTAARRPLCERPATPRKVSEVTGREPEPLRQGTCHVDRCYTGCEES